MSNECFKKCPRIINLENEVTLQEVHEARFLGAYDSSESRRLLQEAYKEAANCAGPQTCERQVQKGFIKKRMETESYTACRLEK